MVNDITFLFEQGTESVLIDGIKFDAISYEGLEASDYEIIAEKNVNAEGERVKKKRILSRQIMVEFDYLYDEYADIRRKLISFFSPYSSGRLTVTYLGATRMIDYEVSSFKCKNKHPSERLSCLVYVKCPDPSFKSTNTFCVPIMTLVGGWKWPFTLPFRLKQYGLTKQNIYNNGHMETPVEIYFRGPAVAPKVINHRTGTYIQIERDLTADETLYISTMYRAITVEIIRGNEREDAWDYLENGSDFFRLMPGDNMIEYNSGSVRSKGVEIYYQERYLGV